MAQRQDIVISHFSHPGHDLVKRHHTGLFRCDMCWEDLSGTAYICRAGCDFCIHESCAGHSQTFSSPEHHVHPLTLVQTRRDATSRATSALGDAPLAPSSTAVHHVGSICTRTARGFPKSCAACGTLRTTSRWSSPTATVPHATPAWGARRTTAAWYATSTTTSRVQRPPATAALRNLKMPLTLRLYDQGSKSRLETPSWTCGVLPILYAESTSRCDAPDASAWQLHLHGCLQFQSIWF
ncbi:hypothetical protein ACQJBY_067576 [Aegilops geniculata]